jgi:hypothetical protein
MIALLNGELIASVSCITVQLNHLELAIEIVRRVFGMNQLDATAGFNKERNIVKLFCLQVLKEIVVDALFKFILFHLIIDFANTETQNFDRLLISRVLGQNEELHVIVER